MRIWDLDPGFLSDKSLLGEHRELHGLFSIHINKKKGYARHPETLRWTSALTGLIKRHEILVSEMTLRGFNHQSPLDPLDLTPKPRTGKDLCWPDQFIDLPDGQFERLKEKYRHSPQGRIPLPRNALELWASHKYSVMARNPKLYQAIGPGVADRTLCFADLSLTLVNQLRLPPPEGRLINALDHMWGYVSDKSEKKRTALSPRQLLDEIRVLAKQENSAYLLNSTAIGELRVWMPPTPYG